ncbi:hypothetical protein B0H19DRAFT_1064919 [Mycena capillaripes]|nr:hypothetical protein B0H19DRAFT_1064919 [Mycena capillaripes]
MWADLREVVQKGQEKPPSNKDEFGEYQRNCQQISDFLKSKNKISDRERDEQFMKGICSDFRFRVLQRLQIVMPDQPSDTPYTISDVIKAAEWAIDGTPGQFYQDTKEDTTIIKKEMVDLTASMREMRTKCSFNAPTRFRIAKERHTRTRRRNRDGVQKRRKICFRLKGRGTVAWEALLKKENAGSALKTGIS